MKYIVASLMLIAVPLHAEEATSVHIFNYDGTFEDAEMSLTNAIEGEGLKIDQTGNVAEMLARTAESVGAEKSIYKNAKIFQFCSATYSRKMMEINPENIAFCPYQIFLYQTEGSDQAVIGYRDFPTGEMQEIEDLLEKIIAEALAF